MKTTNLGNENYKIEMGKYIFYIDNMGDYSIIKLFNKNGEFLSFVDTKYELLEIETIQEILEKNKNVNFEFMI